VLALALLACKREPQTDDAPPQKDKEPTSSSELATTSSTGDAPAPEGDTCESAPTIATSVHTGTLFATAADLAIPPGDDCGMEGADAFVRLAIEQRADVEVSAKGSGFTPSVAILGSSCSDALACATGLPATALDVAADTELVIAIGIGAEDPALVAAAAPEDLAFELTIAKSSVLETGESCGLPGQGRCASGTACLVDEDGAATCTLVEGDTCATATPIALGNAPSIVTVDPAVPYSDAHHHSCGGARRRDRVLHVQWPAPGGTLVASTTMPGVALAIRGPGCAETDAISCAPATGDGAAIEAIVEGPGGAFVFVELPEDDPATAPFDVVLDLVP
jgi:hypothetical protein